MEVTFTKLSKRYLITLQRRVGPELAPKYGPGYDDWLPHDVAHMLVEVAAGLRGGVFGRIATTGNSNIFTPADPAAQRKMARKRLRYSPEAHTDMATSERLASICVPAWELERGRRTFLPEWLTESAVRTVDPALRRRIFDNFDAFKNRWHPLPTDGRVIVTWPAGALE